MHVYPLCRLCIVVVVFLGWLVAGRCGEREVVSWSEAEVFGSRQGGQIVQARLSPEHEGRREAVLDMGPAGSWTVTVRLRHEAGEIVRLETDAVMTGRAKAGEALSRLSIGLPLALEPRKRVVQAGENGLTWQTRSVYQFHTEESSLRLMSEPDTNIWSVFRSDWQPGDTYTLTRWESARTSPLVLHRGSGFPGWLAIYDRKGGVVIAVDESGYKLPLALEAGMDAGGRVAFDLLPPSADPLVLADTKASPRLHGSWKLKVFSGEPDQAGLGLARAVTTMEKPAPNRARPSASLPVFGGVPIAAGLLGANDQVELRDSSGSLVAAQTAPLAFWPDGSVKWLETVFFDEGEKRPARGNPAANGQAELANFKATYGAGDADKFELIKSSVTAQRTDLGLRATQDASGEVHVTTGLIEAVFAPGREWLKNLKRGGRAMLMDSSPTAAYLDMVEVDSPPEPGARLVSSITGRERSVLVAERISLEESGPVRAVVRIEGHTNGRWPCRMVLRLEFYARSAAIRGYHTIVMGDFDVRRVFVTGFGLELPLAIDPMRSSVTVSADRLVKTSAKDGVVLRALHPDVSELRTGAGDDSHEVAVGGDLSGTINVQDEQGPGLVAGIRDFRKMFPTQIALTRRDNGMTLDLAFWPQSAGVMDFRRYSNLPHRSQGETVTNAHNDWVETVYYEQEPVRGISLTQEFMLVPGPVGQDVELARIDAALNDRTLLYAGEAAYVKVGALADDLSGPQFAPAREMLGRFADFLEFHRERWRWYGKWIYGDIQHSFMRGYGRIVKPEALVKLLAEGWLPPAKGREWEGPVTQGKLSKSMSVKDYMPANDWSSDNGRWGWGNTEGLPNRYLSELYLRTGRRDVFFAMEALARHSRDVVIRHEGRWFGSGTRHGVQPWSDGGHQERQSIPSEYRVHRLLTGDKRSRDVLLHYGYDVFLQPKSRLVQGTAPLVRDSVDHSARLYGLLTLWEATGDSAVGDALSRYVKLFVAPDGIMAEPTVKFPEIESTIPAKGLNSGTMFFNTFGAMYSLIEYQSITHDEALRQAICRMAAAALDTPASRAILESEELNSQNFYWPALAFAAQHADEPERFRTFLRDWLSGPGARAAREIISRNRTHWTGPTSFMHTNTPESLFWLNTLASVAVGAGSIPPPTDAARTVIDNLEQNGRPRSSLQPSWQDEYDRPEFSGYLGPWLPRTSRP